MKRVLVVDDSPTEQFVARSILEKNGYQVSVANNGEEGVAKAKAEKPDLIFMDIVMPGMNGFKAVRELSRDPATAGIPVIVLSSKDQEADMEWAKKQGAAAYLVKPAREPEMLAAIAMVGK
jgi:twitching motility two-component system response regulator PilH